MTETVDGIVHAGLPAYLICRIETLLEIRLECPRIPARTRASDARFR